MLKKVTLKKSVESEKKSFSIRENSFNLYLIKSLVLNDSVKLRSIY